MTRHSVDRNRRCREAVDVEVDAVSDVKAIDPHRRWHLHSTAFS